jgi:hypothetical protein
MEKVNKYPFLGTLLTGIKLSDYSIWSDSATTRVPKKCCLQYKTKEIGRSEGHFKKWLWSCNFKVTNWRHRPNYSAAVGTSWNYVIMIACNGWYPYRGVSRKQLKIKAALILIMWRQTSELFIFPVEKFTLLQENWELFIFFTSHAVTNVNSLQPNIKPWRRMEGVEIKLGVILTS